MIGKKKECVVVLVNYNGFDDTKACLESIQLVDGNLPYVVLIDNASVEAQKLESLKALYKDLFIIYSEENLGFGRANNLGIRWAQDNLDFDYLLLLNNDTLIDPKSIFYLIEPFKRDSHIAITTSKTMYEANRDIVWYGGGIINKLKGWSIIYDFQKPATQEGANKAKYVGFISGCVMMFSKSSIEQLQGFDDDYFMYCEDLELSLRASKLGFKLYYEPKSIIYHKVQGSSKSKVKGMKVNNPNLSFLFFHMKSNQWITMKKHLKTIHFIPFNIYFWLLFSYLMSKYLIYGRNEMIKVGWKTFLRIYKYSS